MDQGISQAAKMARQGNSYISSYSLDAHPAN